MRNRRPTPRALLALGVGLALPCACGGEARRPAVAPSATVEELRRSAGAGLQDCGRAEESREEEQCRVKSVGECIQAALEDCRPAQGLRTYFASEGDAIRVDWLVLSDGQGGCDLVVVEDRSADPLASKKPSVSRCRGFVWGAHESIDACEAPRPDDCRKDSTGAAQGVASEAS